MKLATSAPKFVCDSQFSTHKEQYRNLLWNIECMKFPILLIYSSEKILQKVKKGKHYWKLSLWTPLFPPALSLGYYHIYILSNIVICSINSRTIKSKHVSEKFKFPRLLWLAFNLPWYPSHPLCHYWLVFLCL